MQYRNDKKGNPISLIGYGCMRFTKKGGAIDFEKAEKEVLRGIELGINYYDTIKASSDRLHRLLSDAYVYRCQKLGQLKRTGHP